MSFEGERLRYFLDSGEQVKGLAFESELSRFQLRDVENIVDELEHRFGAFANRLGVLLQIRLEIGLHEHVIHANDAVHWGADFMGDARQETRLRSIGALRLVSGHEGFLLAFLKFQCALGDFRFELRFRLVFVSNASFKEYHRGESQ